MALWRSTQPEFQNPHKRPRALVSSGASSAAHGAAAQDPARRQRARGPGTRGAGASNRVASSLRRQSDPRSAPLTMMAPDPPVIPAPRPVLWVPARAALRRQGY